MIKRRTPQEKAARTRKKKERAKVRAHQAALMNNEKDLIAHMIESETHGLVKAHQVASLKEPITWSVKMPALREWNGSIDKCRAALSPTLLEWVRLQPCAWSDCHCSDFEYSEPHHFPPTGANGVQIDPLTIPVCREHHRQCHTGTIDRAEQERVAFQAMLNFWRFAALETKRQVLRELLESLL